MSAPTKATFELIQKLRDALEEVAEPGVETTQSQAAALRSALAAMRRGDMDWWKVKLRVVPLPPDAHRQDERGFWITTQVSMAWNDTFRGRHENRPAIKDVSELRKPTISAELAEEWSLKAQKMQQESQAGEVSKPAQEAPTGRSKSEELLANMMGLKTDKKVGE